MSDNEREADPAAGSADELVAPATATANLDHSGSAPMEEEQSEQLQQDDVPTAATAAAASAAAPSSSSSLQLYDPSSSPPVAAEAATAAQAAPVASLSSHAPVSAAAAAVSGGDVGGGCSSTLPSPFEGDVWLLLLQRLFHSPAGWARPMAHALFQHLQRDAADDAASQQQQQQQQSQPQQPASALLLSAVDWTGVPRPLSLDELMARQSAAAFPNDYLAQLLRELLASKTRDAAGAATASATARDNLQAESALASTAVTAGSSVHESPSKLKLKIKPQIGGGTGYSLAVPSVSAATTGLSLWERGSRALLPSMRPRATTLSAGCSDVPSNVATLLRNRQLGAPRRRAVPTGAAVSSASAPATVANSVYASRLRRHKVVTGHIHAIYCVAMDRTGRRAFTGSDDNTVKVWAVHSGRLIATCRGHEGEITDIGVAPDNSFVASASNDSRIRLWDLNGAPLSAPAGGVLRAHTADVQRLAFNPDWRAGKQLLVSASLDGTACIWDCANLAGPPLVVTTKPRPWPSTPGAAAYVPYDLELLARQGSESPSSGASPFNNGATPGLGGPVLPNPEFLCVSFHPSGCEIVCGHNDHRARVYSLPSGALLAVLSGHRGEVESATYSADGARILTLSSDGEAIVWARVEWSEVQEAAGIVGAVLPTQPPLPPQNIWAHDASTPLAQASFYAGLRRALPPAHAAASARPPSLLSPPPPPAPALAEPSMQSGSLAAAAAPPLPTHRYIIVARLVVAIPPSPSSSAATAAAAAAAAAAASAASASAGGNSAAAGAAAGASSSASNSLKVSSAIWSLHDDCIYGASAGHGVLVWRLPAPVCDGEGRPRLERVDPHAAQHLEHSKMMLAKAAAARASAAAAGGAAGAKQAERATGRSKRSLASGLAAAGGGAGAAAAAAAMAAPAPLNFLSCFARRTLTPSVSFHIHTADVRVLVRHPSLADLLVSAGTDGRVVLFDVARRQVVRVLRESVALDAVAGADGLVVMPPAAAGGVGGAGRSPSNFVDAAFSPACTGGSALLLTTEMGQIYFCGVGLDPHEFLLAPQQQFFVRDYLAIQRDQFDNVLDLDGQCPPHLAPSATTLCDLNLHVYPQALPPVLPLDLEKAMVPVPGATAQWPEGSRALVRDFSAGNEPRYSVASASSARTGVPPASSSAATAATSDAEAPIDTVEVDSDLWRSPGTRAHPRLTADLPGAQGVAMYRAQLARDEHALRFVYQVRCAWQQQRQVIRLANQLNAAESGLGGGLRSGRTRRGGAGGAVSIAPTWYPLLSLPLPPQTPLLDAQEEGAARDDDEEDGEDETRLYRPCVFDAAGIARRIRLSASAVAARTARPSALEALRSPTMSPSRAGTVARHRAAAARHAGAGAGGRAGAGASNIHTLGSTGAGTRRLPIPLDDLGGDEGDDNYRDDDYDPSGMAELEDAAAAAAADGATRTQRRNARAQGRALRRFEDLRAGGSAAGTGSSVVLMDEDEDAAAVALAAVAEASSRDHSEYSAASDSDEAEVQRRRGGGGGGGAGSSGSSDESEEAEESQSSDSDSDASYNARRGNGPSSSRKRKRKPSRSGASGSGRSRSRSRRSDAQRSGGHDSATRRASKRVRPSRREWSASEGEEDEDEAAQQLEADEADEEREERERRAAQREARARKRQAAAGGGSSASGQQHRSAARKPARYQDADSEEDERLFAEEQGDYAARVGGSAPHQEEEEDDDDEEEGAMSRILASGGRNWLARPLTQLYNSSYTPQLGDEVVYCRVGHESTLGKHAALPRTNLPRGNLPPFVEALVVGVEHLWAADAYTGPGSNPFARLPLNSQGMVDAKALATLPAPMVFARVTLVPVRDVALIRYRGRTAVQGLLLPSSSPPPALAAEGGEGVKAEPGSFADEADESDVAHASASVSAYDFSALPPPQRWYEVVSSSEARLRLRRVARPGEGWAPRVKEEAAAADVHAPAPQQQQELGEEFQLVGGRRKRALRGIPESSPAEEDSAPAASQHASHHLPERQSLRRALQESMHDAPSAATAASSSASSASASSDSGDALMKIYLSKQGAAPSVSASKSSSSGSRTRIVLRRGAEGSHTAVDPSAAEFRSAAPASAAPVDQHHSSDELERASRDLALTLQSQPARSSARQRVPKKQDPYEAQLVSNAPQQLTSTRVRGAGGSSRSGGGGGGGHGSGHGGDNGTGVELPPSAFVVDLFEPTDADYLVLASRIRACPVMAPWVSQSADSEAWSESPSPSLPGNTSAAAAASTSSAGAAAATAATAAPPREWCAGDRFRMKFVDEAGSRWSEGVVLSNAMHSAAAAAAAAAQEGHLGGGRYSTRNRSVQSSAPAPAAALVTPWECLRVSWKSEAELSALLEAQAAERSTQLVQAAPPAASCSPEEAAAQARLALLATLDAEDTVSPWEIDRLDRPVAEFSDLDVWIAAMDSRADADAPAAAAADAKAGGGAAAAAGSASASSSPSSLSAALCPSRVHTSLLAHLREPDVLLDPSEHLRPQTVSRLLSLVESARAQERFAAFASPVRHGDFPDYLHVVPYSTDLRTMAQRLRGRYYRSVAAVGAEVRAMRHAAGLYNAPKSEIVALAQVLERELLRDIARAAPGDMPAFLCDGAGDLLGSEEGEEKPAMPAPPASSHAAAASAAPVASDEKRRLSSKQRRQQRAQARESDEARSSRHVSVAPAHAAAAAAPAPVELSAAVSDADAPIALQSDVAMDERKDEAGVGSAEAAAAAASAPVMDVAPSSSVDEVAPMEIDLPQPPQPQRIPVSVPVSTPSPVAAPTPVALPVAAPSPLSAQAPTSQFLAGAADPSMFAAQNQNKQYYGSPAPLGLSPPAPLPLPLLPPQSAVPPPPPQAPAPFSLPSFMTAVGFPPPPPPFQTPLPPRQSPPPSNANAALAAMIAAAAAAATAAGSQM